jgi:hypothetical protein
LPPNAVAVLREHCRKLLETRLALGLGKPGADTLLFGEVDGSCRRPGQLSWLWRSTCRSARVDVVAISRRLGHRSRHANEERTMTPVIAVLRGQSGGQFRDSHTRSVVVSR